MQLPKGKLKILTLVMLYALLAIIKNNVSLRNYLDISILLKLAYRIIK